MFQQVRDYFLTVWQGGLNQGSGGITAFAISFTVSNTVTHVQFLYVAVCRAYKESYNWSRKLDYLMQALKLKIYIYQYIRL